MCPSSPWRSKPHRLRGVAVPLGLPQLPAFLRHVSGCASGLCCQLWVAAEAFGRRQCRPGHGGQGHGCHLSLLVVRVEAAVLLLLSYSCVVVWHRAAMVVKKVMQ